MNQVQEHNSIFDSIMEMQEHEIDSDCLIILSSIANAHYYVENYLTIVQDTMATNYNTDDQTLTDVRCVVDGTLSETVSGCATITKGQNTESMIEKYTCRTTSESYRGGSSVKIGSLQSQIKAKTSYVVGAINAGFLAGLFNLSSMNFTFVCSIGIMGSFLQVKNAVVSSECYLFRNMLGRYIIESYRRYLRFKEPKVVPQIFVPAVLLAPAPDPEGSLSLDICELMDYREAKIISAAEQLQ